MAECNSTNTVGDQTVPHSVPYNTDKLKCK